MSARLVDAGTMAWSMVPIPPIPTRNWLRTRDRKVGVSWLRHGARRCTQCRSPAQASLRRPQMGSAEARLTSVNPSRPSPGRAMGTPWLPPRRGASSRSRPPRGTTARPSELWRQPEGSAVVSSDNPRTLVWLQAFLLYV